MYVCMYTDAAAVLLGAVCAQSFALWLYDLHATHCVALHVHALTRRRWWLWWQNADGVAEEEKAKKRDAERAARKQRHEASKKRRRGRKSEL